MERIPLPKARVGDVVVGDIHPDKGFVMFEVEAAYYDPKYGRWHYTNLPLGDQEKLDMTDMWITHIYKRKDLK